MQQAIIYKNQSSAIILQEEKTQHIANQQAIHSQEDFVLPPPQKEKKEKMSIFVLFTRRESNEFEEKMKHALQQIVYEASQSQY